MSKYFSIQVKVQADATAPSNPFQESVTDFKNTIDPYFPL